MASCYYKPDGISLCRSGANKMEGGLLAVLYGNGTFKLSNCSNIALRQCILPLQDLEIDKDCNFVYTMYVHVILSITISIDANFSVVEVRLA